MLHLQWFLMPSVKIMTTLVRFVHSFLLFCAWQAQVLCWFARMISARCTDCSGISTYTVSTGPGSTIIGRGIETRCHSRQNKIEWNGWSLDSFFLKTSCHIVFCDVSLLPSAYEWGLDTRLFLLSTMAKTAKVGY